MPLYPTPRPFEIWRLLQVMSTVCVIVLLLLSLSSYGWYVGYWESEWDDGERDEYYSIYGLTYVEEIIRTTADGETINDEWRTSYGDRWFEERDEGFVTVANRTSYALWGAISFSIAFLVLSSISMFVTLNQYERRMTYLTALCALVPAVLLLTAVVYFGLSFPPEIDGYLQEWAGRPDQTYPGPGIAMAAMSCVVLFVSMMVTLKVPGQTDARAPPTRGFERPPQADGGKDSN